MPQSLPTLVQLVNAWVVYRLIDNTAYMAASMAATRCTGSDRTAFHGLRLLSAWNTDNRLLHSTYCTRHQPLHAITAEHTASSC